MDYSKLKAQSDPITIEDINLAFGLLTENKK
jgi:hypothetical protein